MYVHLWVNNTERSIRMSDPVQKQDIFKAKKGRGKVRRDRSAVHSFASAVEEPVKPRTEPAAQPPSLAAQPSFHSNRNATEDLEDFI